MRKMKPIGSIIFLVFLVNVFFAQAQKIKIIAYNVEFAKNTTPQAMANLLEKEKADIICFNEVPAQGWTAKVGALLKMPYSHEGEVASANHEKGFDDKTGQYYGKYKSILSKYPVTNPQEIELKGIGWGPTTAVVVDVKVKKNKYVKVFSIHIPSGESNPQKSKSNNLAKIISEKFSSEKRIIVAGDFNDIQKTAPLQKFYDIGFNDAWEPASVDLSKRTTYPSYQKDGYVIDHVLFKGLKAKKADIIEEEGKLLSDHKPVWAVFKL